MYVCMYVYTIQYKGGTKIKYRLWSYNEKKKSQPCARRDTHLGSLCSQHRNDLEYSAMTRTKQKLEQSGFGESRPRC